MRILQLIPGTGSFLCGSCLRDHTLAAGLRRLGHDVQIEPLYLPFELEGVPQEAETQVHMGGVNLFLQQKLPGLANLPRFLRRKLDGNRFLRWVSTLGDMTDPSALGDMTISMLRGEEGRQAKEIERLFEWLDGQSTPDIILLSNAMLIGLARRLRTVLKVPVVCTLQGEQPFLDALRPHHSQRCWAILTERAREVDAFIAVSGFTARLMTERLSLSPSKVFVVHNGIELEAFSPAVAPPGAPTIGFLARMCADKGLPVLVEAFLHLLERGKVPGARLVIVGVQLNGDRRGVRALQRRCAEAGATNRVEFHPNIARDQKIEQLRSFSLLCVPANYGESFGLYLLEAMACGVPVVQPRTAGFTEVVESTGGGVLYNPGDPNALVEALEGLLLDPQRAQELGRIGNAAVRLKFDSDRMARDVALALKNTVDGHTPTNPSTSSHRSQ